MKAEQEAPTTMEPVLEHYTSYFSPREFEIAEILVGLPEIIAKSDMRPRIRVPWGHKKKRSALKVHDQKPTKKSSSSSTVVRLKLPSSSSSPNPGPKIPAAINVLKVERSSPNTPLSFESEEKPHPTQLSRVVSMKRKREEWLEVIEGLTKRKELLQKEIQNVKDYKEKLIKFNLLLQSRNQQLKKQRLIQEVKIEEQNLSLDMQLGQPTLAPTSVVMCSPAIVKQEHYRLQIAPYQYQMQIMDHTRRAVISENHGCRASNTQVASTSLPSNSVKATGLRLVSCNSNGGSILVPDCSFSFPNQSQSTSLANKNFRKAMSAQRRQERYQKNRVKKTSLLSQRQVQEF